MIEKEKLPIQEPETNITTQIILSDGGDEMHGEEIFVGDIFD